MLYMGSRLIRVDFSRLIPTICPYLNVWCACAISGVWTLDLYNYNIQVEFLVDTRVPVIDDIDFFN